MKYRDFVKTIGKPYFTRQDVLLRDISIYDSQLTKWQKEGLLVRAKRGLYVFTDRQKELTPEEMSMLLYEPSYISLESALSHYGFIPEIVHAVTSVTTKTTRTFSNPFGHFMYRSVKPELFFGYVPKETKHGKFLFAEPEKALLDFFYLRPDAVGDSMESLEELRINCEIFTETVNKEKFGKYLGLFKSKKMERISDIVFSLCSPTRN